MSDASKCFTRNGSTLYAIINWSSRRRTQDAAILKKLTAEQTKKYESALESGKPEKEIFEELFPPPPPQKNGPKIEVDLDFLTKEQLIDLISRRTRSNLPSLGALSLTELQVLLINLRP